jgi:hypothetical protein
MSQLAIQMLEQPDIEQIIAATKTLHLQLVNMLLAVELVLVLVMPPNMLERCNLLRLKCMWQKPM